MTPSSRFCLSRLRRAAILASTLAALAIGATLNARAHDYTAGTVVIGHPWARATVGTSRPGGAYLTLANKGAVPDRLTAAESPVAGRVELHRSFREGGMMRMARVEAVDIPAGGEVRFAPGGLHIMLMDLKAPLTAGTKVPLTLVFENAGRVTVEFRIEALGGGNAKETPHMSGSGMGH